jgi:8-hydroxy-5-deazaflavin:NADPH oxidoreductase
MGCHPVSAAHRPSKSVTNALTSDMQLASGCTTSGAEALQKKAGGAKVVKAFNTQFAQRMDSGCVDGQPVTVFAAGDDTSAKQAVMQMARDIGFEAVDAGPLQNARLLEPLGYFNIQLGYVAWPWNRHRIKTGAPLGADLRWKS